MFRQLAKLIQGRPAQRIAGADPRLVEAQRHLESGQPQAAEQICRNIVATEPWHAGAQGLLGTIAVQRGEYDLALRCFSKALEIDPMHRDFRHGLGIAYYNAGNLPQAIRTFEESITLAPKDPAAHNNLGNCYKYRGDLAGAAACYRKAIVLDRKHMPAHLNLGDVLQRMGQFDAAVDALRKASRIRNDVPDIQLSLAYSLFQTGDAEGAVKLYRELAVSHPAYPGLHNALGHALMKLGKTDEAITSFREAIARQPGFALAHNSLGFALLSRNDLDGAIACFRKTLTIKPDFARVHSNLLMTMNYQTAWTQKRLYQESLQFDTRQARRFLRRPLVFENSRDKQRILKVGYVSPDFREHSVAHFTRKLIGAHNRECVEVHCYPDVAKPDAFTQQFQAQADHWFSIVGMDDAAVAERIRRDGIDILVDLSGHSSDNRLLVFAHKPAPVQVTWLGYPNTTGMRAMDYRLTDIVADPPGETDKWHTEKLFRMEHGFLCYQTDEPIPNVSPPPCLDRGHISVGSFNTTNKVTSEVIRVWSQILQSIPDARLLLKAESLHDGPTRAALRKAFAENGIAEKRLDLRSRFPKREDHMGLYSSVDIALDPFPYNGTTTTCEALWMGVPVVCLRGDRHAGRVGASILHRTGLQELVADSEEQYVELVRSLAGDPERLRTLRNTIRERMRQSPLMDVRLFTDTLEDAYRQMWINWCDSKR